MESLGIGEDLGVIAWKGYSTFPKAPEPKPDRQMLYTGHSFGGVLPLYRYAVGEFSGPSWLYYIHDEFIYIYIYIKWERERERERERGTSVYGLRVIVTK